MTEVLEIKGGALQLVKKGKTLKLDVAIKQNVPHCASCRLKVVKWELLNSVCGEITNDGVFTAKEVGLTIVRAVADFNGQDYEVVSILRVTA